jgi:D-alanyl-D-alanine carboxypeptidase
MFFGILILINFGDALSQNFSRSTLDKLQQTVNQWRQSNKIPGVSVSIIIPHFHSVVNLVSGTVKIDEKRKVTPQTLFQICSITKVYTAVLILKLQAENKLSLSQTLGSLLPQYPRWKNITVKQLLNMTSGIPSFSDDKKFNEIVKKYPTRYWTTDETINFVKNKPLLFQSGSHWSYSDINYVLLGMIIEKVSGRTYAQVLRQKILQPLDLSHTYYMPYEYPPFILRRMAKGYSSDNKDVTNVNMSQAGAAGAIIATTQDTARFFYDLFSGKVLEKKQMKEMLTPYSHQTGKLLSAASKASAFGLGMNRWWLPEGFMWLKPQGFIWFKPGGFVGFFAQASVLPKKNIVVVVAANKWTQPGFQTMLLYLTPKLYEIVN